MKKMNLSAGHFEIDITTQNSDEQREFYEIYQLNAFRLINFKAFCDTDWIKLNHLTLLLGENSSGKSTLYQALGMVSEAYRYLMQEERFTNLSRLAGEFGDFDDICNKSKSMKVVKIGFQFLRGHQDIEYWISIAADEANNFGRVADVAGIQNGHVVDFLSYYQSVNLFFMERKPDRAIPQEIQTLAGSCLESLRSFVQSFRVLSAHRYRPERFIQLTGSKPDRMTASGSNAYDILYFLSEIQSKELSEVENWLKKFGYSFYWKMSGANRGQFMLRELKTGMETNLMDNGFGISQSLPLALALDTLSGGTILIDTPEAFLQTKMQSEMGDLLVSGAKKGYVLTETGSEYLTLRVRRRVAEGKISRGDISVYYLEDTDNQETICTEIKLDEYGEFQNIPESFARFFSSDFQDIEKLDEIRRKKRRYAAENCN